MKNILLLGATGSIGSQTIELIEAYPEEFSLKGISGYKNIDKIYEIARKFELDIVCLGNEADAIEFKQAFPSVEVVYGQSGLIKLANHRPEDKKNVLINALVGMVGLKPTIEAIKIDRDILLANKETLVVGGHLIKDLLKKHKSQLIPIDSEHSAIWQALSGETHDRINKIIITASGGSFRDLSRKDLENVTLADALNHPNWNMGKKITIDSATMMNKGFEVIEAVYLFDIDISRVEVILHRESIIHSMVEFIDHSIIAQISNHDMKLPIAYAMFYPKRSNNLTKSIDLVKCKQLNFEKLDFARYPCLGYAIEAFKIGGSMRTVLNASNEAAVDLFLRGKIDFLDIESIIKQAMDNHQAVDYPDLDTIYKIDKEVKESIYAFYER